MIDKPFPKKRPDLANLPALMPKGMLSVILFAALGGLSQKINPWIARELESDWNLTGPRLLVIGMLARSNGLSMGELADALDMSPRGVSRLVDGLENDDYVIRQQDTADQRIYRVTLTQRAESLANELLPIHDKRIQSLFAEFSTKELRTFAKVLGSLHKKLEGN